MESKVGTKTGFELHDSTVAGITANGRSVTVRFRPAYVHRSTGRPGWDAGTGWIQDLDLVIADAAWESSIAELPRDLSGGWLVVDLQLFNNVIPFPLDIRGNIVFVAAGLVDEHLVIRGTRATVLQVGDATYIEEFTVTD